MPPANTAYLIGVIREWEKGFLEDDEYTRLIEAPSYQEATHVLSDTVYGERPPEEHLVSLHRWLEEHLDDERVYQFVSARYDSLNAATALVEKQRGLEIGYKSLLGSIAKDDWQSAIWHDLGWETIPEIWERFLKEWLKEEHSEGEIMAAAGRQQHAWQQQLAFTSLMNELTSWQSRWAEQDEKARPFAAEGDAVGYEKQKDEQWLSLIRKYRFEPIGYDTVMSFWYAKELEVRNIRLLLAAKSTGMKADQLRKIGRSLFRSWQ